ncbi:hypothetical protein [Ensifer soli]
MRTSTLATLALLAAALAGCGSVENKRYAVENNPGPPAVGVPLN